ncbi:hypothetical protein [Chryseolinea sp. H1M3-3]|uniref:hypothetical protein n=1 Tax=Chryseolinea sp. H1M3-3 TaxID=3034144 RepID=UPI0023EC29D6|nr:hypothetical protein [Chryseolinea sp. H1M3-3]
MRISFLITYFLVSFLFVVTSNFVQAQQQRHEAVGPEPVNGLNRLGVEYLKIDFTQDQRAMLDGVELELIFSIDTLGQALLEDVNGINDAAIIDSLRKKTVEVGKFKPAYADGQPVEGFYSMLLRYPTYEKMNVTRRVPPMNYRRLKREDFESFELGERMDVLIGGMMNGFVGNAQDYLSVGGGMKVDLAFAGKRGYGFGFTMSFFGNNRRKDFAIDPTREQLRAPLTLVMGALANKTILRKPKSSILLQLEPAYMELTISPKNNNQDKNDVKFRGFSPGVTLHYVLKLGRDRFTDSYMPAIFNHCLNLHAGIRPVFYNSREASGVLYEVGISYRMIYHFFESYTLKE